MTINNHSINRTGILLVATIVSAIINFFQPPLFATIFVFVLMLLTAVTLMFAGMKQGMIFVFMLVYFLIAVLIVATSDFDLANDHFWRVRSYWLYATLALFLITGFYYRFKIQKD